VIISDEGDISRRFFS